jgi:hypothetical protein
LQNRCGRANFHQNGRSRKGNSGLDQEFRLSMMAELTSKRSEAESERIENDENLDDLEKQLQSERNGISWECHLGISALDSREIGPVQCSKCKDLNAMSAIAMLMNA